MYELTTKLTSNRETLIISLISRGVPIGKFCTDPILYTNILSQNIDTDLIYQYNKV